MVGGAGHNRPCFAPAFFMILEVALMSALWIRTALPVAAAVVLLAAAGLAAAADEKMPAVGEPAPDINLPATQVGKVLPDKKDAKTLDLKDLRGKNVVLYFFPKALTRG